MTKDLIKFTKCPACGEDLEATQTVSVYLDVLLASYDPDKRTFDVLDSIAAYMNEPQHESYTLYCSNDCSEEQIADALMLRHKAHPAKG